MKKNISVLLTVCMLLTGSALACAEQPGQNAVSELYSADGVYTDGVGNSETWSYHVPQINDVSSDAEEINREIAERFGTIVEDQFLKMEGGYSLWAWYTGWKASWNGTELFLLLRAEENGDITLYDVWGYDFESGRRVTNDMILEQRGIGKDEYMESLREKVRLIVEDNYSRIPEKHRDQALHDEMLDTTLNWLDMEQPMFINEYGEVVTIVKVATVAGAGWRYYFAEPFSEKTDRTYAISFAGDAELVESCPACAKAGDSVTVRTYDVTDGDIGIEANGVDGTRVSWSEYRFIMPDHDVEVRVEFIDYGLA
ncbi:MAG: hypothetical protein K6C08_03365 [Oscillospiraceae bacterium]|nr:hypothetical protein [Oscillospiraceae bacterium]